MNKTAVTAITFTAGFVAGGILPGRKLLFQNTVIRTGFKALVDQRINVLALQAQLDAAEAACQNQFGCDLDTFIAEDQAILAEVHTLHGDIAERLAAFQRGDDAA